jgi:hypothetical protein
MSITIYITVLVTRGRHFGARESVWSYFFEAKPRKNISKTDSRASKWLPRASKWLPRSQKQCWIKLYITFGWKWTNITIWPRDRASISVQQLRIKSNSSNETPNVMTVGVENYGLSICLVGKVGFSVYFLKRKLLARLWHGSLTLFSTTFLPKNNSKIMAKTAPLSMYV